MPDSESGALTNLANPQSSVVLAGDVGFEPTNAGIKIRCLNQLGESPTIHALHQTIQGMLLQPLNQTALIFA